MTGPWICYLRPRDEVVFDQGHRGDRLYIVVDGQVEIIRDAPGRSEELLARLGPGECFGEMALVNDGPRMATARTAAKTNLLSADPDRDGFNALFAFLPRSGGYSSD